MCNVGSCVILYVMEPCATHNSSNPNPLRCPMTTQLTFAFEKETKGAVRYQEQGIADGAEGTIGTLYIRKSALRDLNGGRIPSTLTVTVEAQ